MNEGNVGLIDKICVGDALNCSPFEEIHGRNELETQISGLKESFNDFSTMVGDMITEGDAVTVHVTLRRTHGSAFTSVEPTGKPIEVSNIVFIRVEDDVIAEQWVQPDMLGILAQLGTVESLTA